MMKKFSDPASRPSGDQAPLDSADAGPLPADTGTGSVSPASRRQRRGRRVRLRPASALPLSGSSLSPAPASGDRRVERLWVTVREASTALSICRTVVYGEMKAGRLEWVKRGRSRRIPMEALRRYAGRQG